MKKSNLIGGIICLAIAGVAHRAQFDPTAGKPDVPGG